MPTTPNLQIPYPLPNDLVTDGAAAMQAIAERLDDLAGLVFQSAWPGGFTVPSATFTQVMGSGLVTARDAGGAWNETTGEFTAPAAGLYEFTAACVFMAADPGVGNHRLLCLDLNKGGAGFMEQVRASAPLEAGGQSGCSFAAVVELATGDQARFRIFQDSGGTMTMPSPGAGNLPNTLVSGRYLGS